MPTAEDWEVLGALLATKGLGHLLQKCEAERFNLHALRALDEVDELGLVTTYAGEKVLLRKLLRESRPEGVPLATESPTSSGGRSTPSCSSSSPSGSGLNPSSTGTKRPGDGLLPVTVAKLSKVDVINEVQKLDLRLLLELDGCGGKYIMQTWDECQQLFDEGKADRPTLSKAQRDKVANIIAAHLLTLSDIPDHNLNSVITKKIVTLFPSESEVSYYVAPRTDSLSQTHPKGKIPNAVRNIKSRSKLRASFNVSPLSTTGNASTSVATACSSLQSILKTPITEEIKVAGSWLAHGRTPWPTVLEKWAITAPLRFKSIFDSKYGDFINEYLNSWPVLGHKSGYQLILQDFHLMRQAAASLLFDKWSYFISETIKISERDVKDKPSRALLNTAKSVKDSECVACAVLQLLPAVRPHQTYTTANGDRVKATIQSSRDSYLLIVAKEADLKTALSSRRQQLTEAEAGGGCPLIVIVSPNPEKIISVHVSVANLRFTVKTIAEAVDLFFKLFHTLHLKYPLASAHIWTTLQRGVYDFSTEFDFNVQHSWIKCYK